MDTWHLIVGLGNPGDRYSATRHNAGFMALERLAERWRGSWSDEKKFNARIARVDVSDRRVLLCQPQTFMNLSGEAVGALAGGPPLVPFWPQAARAMPSAMIAPAS